MDAPATKTGGWIKAALGALAGVISGGMLMYVSPLVDKVIKPQKPLANFSVQSSGLQITLLNRSLGGDGFWDFGDGSPLEPASPDTTTVTHTYMRPGQYMVKLTIRNFLGDENERSAPVVVKGVGDGSPAILSLRAEPVCPKVIAPATFRVVSKAQNVETCVWDFGADRPLEISSESPDEQERLVTFAKPGKYNVQLAVLNGKLGERKTVTVNVEPAPANALMAVISCADHGTRVESRTEMVPIALSPELQSRPFERTIPARTGYKVADAKIEGAPPAGVSKIAIYASADRSKVTVAGDMALPARSSPTGGPPNLIVPVAIRYERTVDESRPTSRCTAPLKVPGTTVMPLAHCPPNWVSTRRAMVLELFDGTANPRTTVQIPCTGTPITWHGQRYFLTVTVGSDSALITLQ